MGDIKPERRNWPDYIDPLKHKSIEEWSEYKRILENNRLHNYISSAREKIEITFNIVEYKKETGCPITKSSERRYVHYFKVGEEVRLGREHINDEGNTFPLAHSSHPHIGIQLLSNQFTDLLSLVEVNRLQKAQNIEDQQMHIGDSQNMDMDKNKNKNNISGDLWIDKYTPKQFSHLVTEERTNREVLTWLKSWDEIVFPSTYIPPKAINTNFNQPYKQPISFASGKKDTFGGAPLLNKLSFKKYKILLLAGPPGVGKTTLARVIATHCGYNPLEINASDERSKDKLMNRVYNATQIDFLNFGKGVEGGNLNKPHCLILDEIDGAVESDSHGAIQALVNFIKTEKFPTSRKGGKGRAIKQSSNIKEVKEEEYNSEEEENKEPIYDLKSFKPSSTENKSGNKQSTKERIKRPIICICNDLYAKVMRPLREISLIYQMKSPNGMRMINTLRDICKKEQIVIENELLKQLCIAHNFDIRSCINNLQLASKYNNSIMQAQLGYKVLHSEAFFRDGRLIFCKNSFENIFEIWKQIMTNKQKKNIKELKALARMGDTTQKVNEGLFVNYLNGLYYDEKMISTAGFLDIFEIVQICDTLSHRLQAFDLLQFSFLPIAYYHFNFATSTYNSIEFPKLFYALNTELKKSKAILSILQEYPEHSSKNSNQIASTTNYIRLDKSAFIADLLQHIVELLQPSVREINYQLLTEEEKVQVELAILIMLKFNISFNGNYSFEDESKPIFDPDITSLIHYDKGKYGYRMGYKLRGIMKGQYEKAKAIYSSMQEEEEHPQTTPKDINKTPDYGSGVKSKVKLDFLREIGERRNRNQMETPVNFTYKYKEGFANMIKRQVNLDFFL